VRHDQKEAVEETDAVDGRYVILRSLQREKLPNVALQRERQKQFARRYLVMLVKRAHDGQDEDRDEKEAASRITTTYQSGAITRTHSSSLLIVILLGDPDKNLEYKTQEQHRLKTDCKL
jgi:hypothetical protein